MTAAPANIIQLIEAEGAFWVQVVMDGEALSRRGPFATADEAESVAIQCAAICRVFHQPMELCRG